MSLGTIKIEWVAVDNASAVNNSVKSSIDEVSRSASSASGSMREFGDSVTGAASARKGLSEDELAASAIESSSAKSVEDALNRVSFGSEVAGGKYKNFTEILASSTRVGSSAMIALDRMQIAMDAVSNAQIREQLAQSQVNEAVAKYGANSQQAIDAKRSLEIATRGVEIAQQREEVRMIYGSLVVVPQMVNGIRTLIASLTAEQLAVRTTAGAYNALFLAKVAALTVGVGIPVALAAMTMWEMQLNTQQASLQTNTGGATTNIYGDVNNYNPTPTMTNPQDFAQVAR